MKRIVAILIFAGLQICWLAGAGTAQAADAENYIAVSGFGAFSNIDEQQSVNKFTGNPRIDFGNSWGIQAKAGHRYSRVLAVEAMLEYIFPFEANKFSPNSDEINVFDAMVNARVSCPWSDAIIPYAVLGVGAVRAYEEIKYNGKTSKDRDWGAGIRGGIGIEYPMEQNLSLTIEAAYLQGVGEVDYIGATQLSMGLAYRF